MLIEGSARSILGAERTALNFIQRLSGVATLTRKYVKAVSHTSARILDTRKTTPGYRLLEKAAVAHGGGTNHRMGLYDRAMVKDNHLMTDGNTEHLQQCINRLRAEKPGVEIQLEADTLEQVEAFLKLEGVDHILLDNMTPEMLKQAVAMRGDRATPLMEASGGVNLTRWPPLRNPAWTSFPWATSPTPPPPWTWGWISAWNNTYLSPYHGPVQFQRRIPQGPASQKRPGGKPL